MKSSTITLLLATFLSALTANAAQHKSIAPPRITGLYPQMGSTAGAARVTITGSNLTHVMSVIFGASSAASFTVVSSSQITAVTPSEAAGVVSIVLGNSAGASTLSGGFTFVAPPALQATPVSPSSGPASGGTVVTITGSNFQGLAPVTSVLFGANSASSFTIHSNTQITAVAPAGASGVVNVSVATAMGLATATGAYTYTAGSIASPPSISEVSPSSGPIAGGNQIVITGANFQTSGMIVAVGANQATVVSQTATSATVVAPGSSASGYVSVEVENSSGQSATMPNAYQYTQTTTPPPPPPGGGTDGPANLPAVKINTTFPSQTSASIYNVNPGDSVDLQNKIDTAAANCGLSGAVVNVPASGTYNAASRFTLPATNCTGGARVVIESASMPGLSPQGTRISASNANMPTLTNSDIAYPVIIAADNPSDPPAHYWLAGLEIVSNAASSEPSQLALLVLGDYCNQIGGGGCPITPGMSAANLANDFTIDRCWIHGGSATANIRHGIRFTASNVAVEDSIISDIHDSSVSGRSDSTGISSDFTFGPVDIGNSEVAAVSENILFGGTDPTIPGSVPSDIYVHHNYIHKLASWSSAGADSYQPQMKDLLECKNCQRLLVEGNWFDTNYDNSSYSAFHMTPRNANGKCTWCVVQDVTNRYNWFRNLGDWVSFLGANGSTSGGSLGPELPFKRGSYHDNLVENLDTGTYGGNGRFVQINLGHTDSTDCSSTGTACQFSDLSIVHNSLVSSEAIDGTGSTTANTFAGSPTTADEGVNWIFRDNIVPAGRYGFGGDIGSVHPLNSLFGTYFSSYTYTNNVITNIAAAGFSGNDLPANNFNGSLAANQSALGYVNYNSGIGGDYHLASSSPYKNQASDGTDPGANIDKLNSYIANAISGGSGIISQPDPSNGLSISPSSIPSAIVNSSYSVTLAATGGSSPYTWNVISSALPAGFSLNAGTGVISGTSSIVESGTFTVQVADSAAHTASRVYTLIVASAGTQIAAAVETAGKDERGNNYAQVAFPGFAQLRVADGSAEVEGYRSGLSVFWDLKNDPDALYPIEGQDCGLGLGIDYGYAANGVLLGSVESKCSPGTITVLESNNVRLVVSYDWVNTEGGPTAYCAGSKPSAQCIATPNFTGHYIYTIYRTSTGGSKVYGRMSFTNSTGVTINMDPTNCPSGQTCEFQYNFAQSWTDFSGEGLQYAPYIGIGYSDPYWQTIASYAPKTPAPWGWGSDDDVNQTNIHFIMHSTGISTAPTSGLTITNGSTKSLATGTIIPVKSSFLEITNDNGGSAAYIEQAFVGARSKIEVPGASIPSNGADSLVKYALWLGGDNGVVQESDASAYATEFRAPAALTMNIGTSQGFKYDRGEFQLTASSNAVDFLVGGVLHSPEFTISNWGTAAPAAIRLNGTTLTLNMDYVAVAESDTLELQIMRQLNANDHAQIP